MKIFQHPRLCCITTTDNNNKIFIRATVVILPRLWRALTFEWILDECDVFEVLTHFRRVQICEWKFSERVPGKWQRFQLRKCLRQLWWKCAKTISTKIEQTNTTGVHRFIAIQFADVIVRQINWLNLENLKLKKINLNNHFFHKNILNSSPFPCLLLTHLFLIFCKKRFMTETIKGYFWIF